MIKKTLLGEVRFFRGLSESTLEALATICEIRRFRKGQLIYLRGDPADALYLLLEGRVRMVLPSPSGGELILGEVGPGEEFGVLGALDGGPRYASALVAEDAEALVLRRSNLLALMASDARVATEMAEVLARRLRSFTELLSDTIFLDLTRRIAKRLWEAAVLEGEPSGQGQRVVRMTQRELAERVGASREAVTRHLSRLKNLGLVQTSRGRIVLPDHDMLRRLAMGELPDLGWAGKDR